MSGIVFAFNFIPHSIDSNIEAFWRSLERHLNSTGKQLIVITTCQFSDHKIPFILVPYSCLDFADHEAPIHTSRRGLSRMIQSWYKCSPSRAHTAQNNVLGFFSELFSRASPAAVISWQSIHPISRLVRNICVESDIPWWCLERGWLPNTLMIDSHENNSMGDYRKCFGLIRLRSNYQINSELMDKARLQVDADYASRYPSHMFNPAETDLSRSKFAVFFNHSRPFFEELGNSRLANFHGLEPKELIDKLNRISSALHEKGITLIIKEHPISRETGFLGLSPSVKYSQESNAPIKDLISHCTHIFLSTSSIQFSLALKRIPFGLLGPGLLSGVDQVPTLDFSSDIHDFLKVTCRENTWPDRWPNIENQISFIADTSLLQIHSESAIEGSCLEIAQMLDHFNGGDQLIALNQIKAFLSQAQ